MSPNIFSIGMPRCNLSCSVCAPAFEREKTTQLPVYIGPQGTGKTTAGTYTVKEKLKRGFITTESLFLAYYSRLARTQLETFHCEGAVTKSNTTPGELTRQASYAPDSEHFFF